MDQKTAKAEELFFVVDETDQPVAPLPRKMVHGRGVWHRVSHIWVHNSQGQILCQQRSFAKELLPGMWEPFFGGHLHPGESYLEGAIREVGEELGIKPSADELGFWKIHKMLDPTGYNNEFQGVFMVLWDGAISELKLDSEEVEQVVWKDKYVVQDSLKTQGGKSWVRSGYELELVREFLSPTRG